MMAGGSTGPVLPRVLDLLIGVLDRAFIEPVRSGRLRATGWPPGLRTVVTITLVIYGVLALVAVSGSWLRQVLDAGTSLFAISPQLLGPATAITAVLVAILAAAGLHAPVPLRILGLLAPVLLWSSQLALAVSAGPASWALIGLLALVVVHLVRRRRGFAWWEPVVTLVIVGGVTGILLATVVRPAIDAGHSDPSLQVMLTIMSAGSLGLGYAITSGTVASEVAMTTAAWFTEHLSRRFSARSQLVVLTTVTVLVWVALGVQLFRAVIPAGLLAVGVVIAVVMAVVMLLMWALLDQVIDRREVSAGRAPGTTDLADIASAFGPLAVAIGIALGAPHAASIIWGNLERGLREPLSAIGIDYVPQGLVERLGSDGSTLILASEVTAVVICALLCARGAWRARRGEAMLALVVGLFCLVHALDSVGVPFLHTDLTTLAVATLVVVTGAGVVWVLQRKLTIARLHAVGIGVLLAGAIAVRELLADPIGWLLGSAAGGLLVLGLVWNLLTNADLANTHSPTFPRASRTLVIVGYLTTAMLVAAADAVSVSFAVDLDRFVVLGGEVIGTALLAAATWAVLATGAKDTPALER